MNFSRVSVLMSAILIAAMSLFLSEVKAAEKPIYFLWDVGFQSNKVDRGDLIFDLSKGCNDLNGLNINFPGEREPEILPAIPIPTFAETQSLLKGFGMSLKDKKFFELIWVFDKFKGAPGPTFILLPEAHKVSSAAAQEKDTMIQLTRTYFTLGLIEENLNSKSFLNVREGILGTPWRLPKIKISKKSRIAQVSKLMDSGYVTAFTVIGNLYADLPNVFSSYLEPSNFILEDILLNLGDYDGVKTFEQTIAIAKKFTDGIDSSTIGAAREVYNNLLGLTRDQTIERKNQICAIRSHQMVEKAILLAQSKKADIVFLSYGASHHFEVSQYLRTANLSYVALLGRNQ